MCNKQTIVINGIDYEVESIGDFDYEIEAIWVFSGGEILASAESDVETESVYYSYYDEEGKMEDFGGESKTHFWATPIEMAEWLINTHPSN